MIPKDPAMLLSYINSQLRDHYASFEDLCASLQLDGEAIKKTLRTLDYELDEAGNQFV